MFLVLGAETIQHGRMHDDAQLKIRLVARAFLEQFLELALDLHAHGGGGLDLAATFAIRTVVIHGGANAFTVALAGHLHQAKLRDRQDVGLGLVAAQTIPHPVVNLLAVAPGFHVNEIKHDESAHVAKAKLPRDFLSSFEVHFQDQCVLIFAAFMTAGVHVNRHERFGFINDDGAAALQIHLSREGVFQLLADVEAVEHGLRFGV